MVVAFSFKNGRNVTDEDTIDLKISDNTEPDRPIGQVKVILRNGPDVTWWKGLTSGQWEILSCQDGRHGPTSHYLPEADVKQALFGKAKMFGAHAPMYNLMVDGSMKLDPSKVYEFTWIKDF